MKELTKDYLCGEAVAKYVRSVSVKEHDTMRRLREETAAHPRAIMQIAPEQAQLYQLLLKLMRAKRTLEIGVFTGYSSLAVALALPDDGTIVACDISEEYTQTARRYWKEAGVAAKIDLRIAPAAETLQSLLDSGENATFDFAFIDADKTGYDQYYELCLRLVRTGGLIIFDNTLYHATVPDPTENEPDTVALRALNEKLAHDDRVLVSLLAIADGVTLVLKL